REHGVKKTGVAITANFGVIWRKPVAGSQMGRIRVRTRFGIDADMSRDEAGSDRRVADIESWNCYTARSTLDELAVFDDEFARQEIAGQVEQPISFDDVPLR